MHQYCQYVAFRCHSAQTTPRQQRLYQSMATPTQLYALNATQSHLRDEEVQHLKAMLAEKVLKIERLRMQVEDLRQAQMSPSTRGYPILPRMRQQTWREFGDERNDWCVHVNSAVIEPALDCVRAAQEFIDADRPELLTHRETLAMAELRDAQRILEDRATEDGYEDEYEEVEEEEEQENDADEDDTEL